MISAESRVECVSPFFSSFPHCSEALEKMILKFQPGIQKSPWIFRSLPSGSSISHSFTGRGSQLCFSYQSSSLSNDVYALCGQLRRRTELSSFCFPETSKVLTTSVRCFSGSSGKGDDVVREESGKNLTFLSWYTYLLEKHPLLTKAITSGLLTLMGDLICQLVVNKVQVLDNKRMFVFTLLGVTLVGPALHYWYSFLGKSVTHTGTQGALLRLLLDQIVFAPMFVGVLLAYLLLLEGKPSHIIPKLQQEWFSSLLANWQLWIPFQFLNFRFVPPKFQVLAANFISLLWNVILSSKAHREIIHKP